MEPVIAYAAVRKDTLTGIETIMTGEISYLQNAAREMAANNDAAAPSFARDYPVVRIAEVEIKEIVR